MWADPVVVAVLIAQQNQSNVRHCIGLNQSLDVLQPPCGVSDFLLFAAIENQNQTIHVQRHMTLHHCRTCVETRDRVIYKDGITFFSVNM